jgi:hypothetical protein
MSDDRPQTFGEALAEEYRALRPESFAAGADPEALFAAAHRDSEPLAALCISGGGIRSATFALGVVQGLAERGVLGRFDYLSTVSGGGYLGGLLSAWAHRAGGLGRIVPRLRRDAPRPGPGEADPVGHLREYSSYLSPRIGAFSSDTWTLVATVLRNILLNWLVLVPLLMLVSMAPRFYLSVLAFPELIYGGAVFHQGEAPDYSAPALDAVSDSPWVRVLLPAASGLLFALALFNILRFLPGVGGRDHTRADFLLRVLAPLAGAVLTFLAFDSLYYLGEHFVTLSNLSSVVLWTAVPAGLAWIAFLVLHRRPIRERLRLLFGPLSLAIAFMAAGIGFATWLTTNFVLWSPNPGSDTSWAAYVTVGPPLVLLGFWFGTVLFMGLASRLLSDEDREWSSRAAGNVLIACVAWAGICAVVLVLPRLALERDWLNGALAAVGTLSAAAAAFGGSLVARGEPAKPGRKGRSLGRWLVARVAPPLFIACLFVALAILLDLVLVSVQALPGVAGVPELAVRDLRGEPVPWNDHYGVLGRSSLAILALVSAALAALAWAMARFVNINTFSLHGMYRDRLVRAYLGASNPERSAHGFTGFAREDDLPIHELRPRGQPLHVVNLTLNLVSPTRLAWQERKAEPFTATPFHCGSRELGYRSAAEYGGGISLGTAVAISGAAASPSMGYHSSPVVSFIMTLFNARLGSWLGNPGAAGERTWREEGPRSAVRSLAKEALGLTSDRSEYVYLSDGGHFENLGLYEMVLRRCRWIVALDGGCDPGLAFDDLGNALRKIRIDLGIPIDFEEGRFGRLRARERRCALASIRYSAVDGPVANGWLLYVKPLRLGSEPPDVDSYAAAHPAFPHQGTGDQWFDESQTESYRMLGLQTVDEVLRGWEPSGLEELRRHVEEVYLGARRPPAG